ncbi:MAG TPA: hypothetical protein VN938_01550 [Xanthobacteraceae bacterium]|nr:hypothetical protein [Xanthobacteraceae bacterium]
MFERQLGIVTSRGLFSDQGDSGAIVLDMNDAAVGLVANGSSLNKVSFANPIEPILRHFGVAPV